MGNMVKHNVLRKTWDCWSAGTSVTIIEYVDQGTAALVRINRTIVNEVRPTQTPNRKKVYVDRRSEQVVIPLDYITTRKRG